MSLDYAQAGRVALFLIAAFADFGGPASLDFTSQICEHCSLRVPQPLHEYYL